MHNTKKRRSWPLTLAALGLLAFFQIQALTRKAEADKTTSGSPALIKHLLHGSTPTLAWSPDSSKLVVNAAYEYFGFDRDILQDLTRLGLYVVDVHKGKVSHVVNRQAYHPFWLDNHTLGWGHSPYEKGAPGIFLHKLASPPNTIHQVGSVRGVYHTCAGNSHLRSTKGKILFWNGFPESKETWMLADPRTGRVAPAPAVHGKPNSWDMPSPLSNEQCLQKVGNVSVTVTHGRVRLTIGRRKRTLPGTVPIYSNDQCYVGKKVCSGYLRACLSPDGTHLAYLTVPPGAVRARLAKQPQVGHIPLELRVVKVK